MIRTIRFGSLTTLLLAVACGPGVPSPMDPGDADDLDAGVVVDAAPVADAGGLLGPPWKLVWQDEFELGAGTRPEPTRWQHNVGGDGWGNEQLEYDTDRVENSSHDGQGNLVITARREDLGGRSYTSARLVTQGRFDRKYGRFEARMKLPRGQGIWPAFWLLGNNISNAGWPQCGEIDIMEYRGHQTEVIRGSLHGPGYSGGANHGRETDANEDLSAGFHTYAVEWDPSRIIWKIDERVYFTATPADLPAGTEWVYDHPFFIILNLAVGGNYSGNPDGSTVFPQVMVIDHVRVYERIP